MRLTRPGTMYLDRWNQVDVAIKKNFRSAASVHRAGGRLQRAGRCQRHDGDADVRPTAGLPEHDPSGTVAAPGGANQVVETAKDAGGAKDAKVKSFTQCWSTVLFPSVASASSAARARSRQTRRPVGEEWNQVRPLFALVEQAAAGQPRPADVTLNWQCHFLNAKAGVVFVPFTLTSGQKGELTSFPVAMYIRVVARGALAPAPGPRDALAQYPFEDAAVFDPPAGRPNQPRLHRTARCVRCVHRARRETPDSADPDGPKRVVLKRSVDITPGLSVDLHDEQPHRREHREWSTRSGHQTAER